MILWRTTLAASAMIFAPALTPAEPLYAQAVEPQDSVVVESGELEGSSGRSAVNLAAGTGNQQVGAATIAVGEVALSGVSVSQHDDRPLYGDRATQISVGERAFAQTSGLTSVNITAGNSNQSANLASLAISAGIGTGGALADGVLAQSRAQTKPYEDLETGPATANDRINVADDAFSDGSGLFQVNLIGGERNSSANTFAISISGNDK